MHRDYAVKRLLLIAALLVSPLVAQTNPSAGPFCVLSSNTCTLTGVVAGSSIAILDSNFNTGGATAAIDGTGIPVFSGWPTIWDAGTATSTLFVAVNVSAGSHVVTVAHNAGDHFNTTMAFAVTGTSTVNPVEYVHSSITGTAASCTGTTTTTHTNDLIVSFINAAGSTAVSLGTSTQSMTLLTGAGNVGAAWGVVPTASNPTAVWNITSGAPWVCDTIAFKPNPATPPTVSSIAVTPVSPSVVANAHITLTATATYSDGGLQDVSGAASTWASSNSAVALISTLGVVNPQSAGTTNATATFNSVTSPNDLVTVTPYTPINWYIRPGGGTRFSSNVPTGQCDGKGDVNYPGSGTNQHCAFNDVRFLVFDGSSATDPTFPARGWVIASSDIVTIRGSIGGGVSYRIGYPANGDPSTGGGYPFFGISGDVGNSGIPSPPPGSVSQPTTIQGENFAACHTGGSVTQGGHILQSALTQLYGGWGIGHIIDLYGTQNIKLQCLDLTDHAQCGTLAAGTGSPQCKSGSTVLADYAATGLHFHNNSTGIILNDISIHGLGGAGIGGSPGDSFVANYLDIIGNENAGWNADDSDGTTGVGSLNVTNFNINWNGCIEEYPIVDSVPYIYCRDQGTGGYGDGFGTASLNSPAPGWQVHFDQGNVDYNTQDGLDALHIGGAGSTMTETRVLAYGNEGQQLKVGGATGRIQSCIIFGNCDALAKATLYNPGGPGEFGSEVNSNVATFHVSANIFSVGATIEFTGLVNLPGLNGTTATVLASGLSVTQFSVNFTHADTVHGQIQQLYQNQHGSGMTLGTYPVTFTGGGGTGAAGTFQATSATDGIPTITNPGSGYTSNPTVSVSGTGGTPPPIYAQIVANEQGDATYPITGRPIVTHDDLANVCRAGDQAIFATVSPGFTTSIQDNTIYEDGQIGMEIEYADAGDKGSTNVGQYTGNVLIAFPGNAYSSSPGTFSNAIFSNDNLNMFTNPGGLWSHNSYLNADHGWVCPNPLETGDICTTPGLVDETMPPLSTVDVTPASGASAVVGAGLFLAGVPLDFAGLTRPNPPSIGALEFAGAPPTVATPTPSPSPSTYPSTVSVTLSTVTGGATICFTTNGSTPGAATAGTCDVGSTTYGGAIAISVTTTLKALGTLSGDTNSAVFSGVYTITPLPPSGLSIKGLHVSGLGIQ